MQAPPSPGPRPGIIRDGSGEGSVHRAGPRSSLQRRPNGLVADASVTHYDALLLPGGTVNPNQLRVDPDAVSYVREFVESGKPVAAICHGPWTLIEAGVVEGRTLTSFPSIRTDLRNAGADVVDQDVVVDGNLITSRSPDDLPAFCDTMEAKFASNSTQEEVMS